MTYSYGPERGGSASLPVILQAWADAFRSDPDLQGVQQVYEDLKQKGVEFPETDLDSLAPIITPKRVHDHFYSAQIRLDFRTLIALVNEQPNAIVQLTSSSPLS